MKEYLIQAIIEQDEDGVYIASCPAFDGCYTQGNTYEEVVENIKDVIEMCIQELKEKKGEFTDFKYPEVIGIRNLKVAI